MSKISNAFASIRKTSVAVEFKPFPSADKIDPRERDRIPWAEIIGSGDRPLSQDRAPRIDRPVLFVPPPLPVLFAGAIIVACILYALAS